jgi:hypothetical protein
MDVKDQVKEFRQSILSKGEKVDEWVAIQDRSKQSKVAQAEAFWGSGTKEAVRKHVLKARYGRLATRNKLCLWNIPGDTCAICTICKSGEVETPGHLLLSCKNEEVHPQHMARHKFMVRDVVKTLKRCSKGRCLIRYDPGGVDKVVCKYTVTPQMLSWPFTDGTSSDFKYPTSSDERGRVCTPSNPDIVVIEREQQHGWDEVRVTRSGGKAGVNRLRGRLVILEVTYAWDTKWEDSEKAKTKKYGPLVSRLKEVGWKVEFRVLVMGVTGVSRNLFEVEQARRLGLTKSNCRKLELRIARSSWGYVRSMCVSRCKAAAAIEAQTAVGGGGAGGGGAP